MNKINKHNTFNTISHWQNFRIKLVFEGIGIGFITGLIIVAYRLLLEKAGELTSKVYGILSHKPWLIPVWMLLLVLIGYFVGMLVKKEPMISGSGIPQVEGVLIRKFKMNWWRVILGKFIGGVLSIGSGLSLGREGPSVQLGAAVGQGFSRVFKRIKIEEKYLITSGASAGLAAAFNAPLAGVMFSLEEVHKNFSPLILLSALSSALTADFVSSRYFGLKPVFNFQNLSVIPLNYYAYIILLGILLGLFGALFNYVLLKTLNLYAAQKWLPSQFRPILPLMVSVVLGFALPQVLGGGHELITSLVGGNFVLKLLLIIFAVKFLFTMLSFGSGAPGGIFLPLLSIGALLGNIYAVSISHLFHIPSGYVNNFIILSMAGYFTAVVRSPITGSILITEMTGSFTHLLSLVTVSVAAYITADLLGSKPVYEALLDRMQKLKGDNEFIGDGNVKIILEIAVCMGSKLDYKKVKDQEWPRHCLLVGIKRGGDEIIPKGNTVILPGDYLIVLTDEENAPEVKENLLTKAEACSL